MAEGYLGIFKYGGSSINQNSNVEINIPILTEKVDNFERLKLLDQIWFEVKNMTKAIQVLTNLLVKMQTGLDQDIYLTPSRDEEVNQEALNAFREKVCTRSNSNLSGQNQELIEALSQIFLGRSYQDIKKTNNNFGDIFSKVITGKKYTDLELEKRGGETGEYDSTLTGRLHKSTELLLGIITGLFAEDEIKSKLEKLNIQDQESIDQILGKANEKASLLKSDIYNQERLIRAIQALVLSFIHGDIKGDLRMAELRQEPFPENIPEKFWEDLKAAYSKLAGDFVHNIKNRDKYDDDNHPYGDMNLSTL